MTTPCATWPQQADALVLDESDARRTTVIDLRELTDASDVREVLLAICNHLIDQLAGLTPPQASAAVVVRHRPAPSGRVSITLAGEAGLCATRSFVRQLRYDRAWIDTPLVFVDGRDAPDSELASVVAACLAGQTRIDVDRSSGSTTGAGWVRGGDR